MFFLLMTSNVKVCASEFLQHEFIVGGFPRECTRIKWITVFACHSSSPSCPWRPIQQLLFVLVSSFWKQLADECLGHAVHKHLLLDAAMPMGQGLLRAFCHLQVTSRIAHLCWHTFCAAVRNQQQQLPAGALCVPWAQDFTGCRRSLLSVTNSSF